MIIWNGLGFVIIIIAVACLLLGNLILGAAWSTNSMAQGGALLITAALTFLFDKIVLAKRVDKTLMNKETGEDVTIRRDDSLFFVPFRFWPLILAGLAVVVNFM